MKDRSLDEFLGAGGEASDGADADGGGTVGVEESDGAGTDASSEADRALDAVDPATPTYRWDADGLDCTACGSHVERGWFDDGAFVCPDCTEW